MNPVIEIKDLVVQYGKTKALDGLSLRVNAGEIFGFIGPNGSGKTSTIKALLGLLFPTRGSISVNGLPPSDKNSRKSVGFLSEEATYYRFLTPDELLTFYGELCGVHGKPLKERIERLLNLVGLISLRHRRLQTFSKGMMQKVGLAQCLIHEPTLLILDEPTSGLDPLAKMDLRQILKNLKGEGKTIFFSSHELSEVELLTDAIAIIQSGKLVRAGSLAEVLGQDGKEINLERFFLETIRGKKERPL